MKLRSDLNTWEDEGGSVNEDFDLDGDREPRIPIRPNRSGGAEAPVPSEAEEPELIGSRLL